MASDLGKVGLLALGIMIISPQGRKQLSSLVNELAEAWEREARRKEAQLQAEAAISVLRQWAEAPPLTTPVASKPQRPALEEPDVRWRDVIMHPAVVLILGKRGSGKTALALMTARLAV